MNTFAIEQNLLYMDDHFIVINKPAGLRVIPDGFDPTLPNIRDMLNAIYPKIWVVHRLDKDTSGVLLFARDAATHSALNQQFENRTIQKEYSLIVIGEPNWETISISLPLRTNGDRKHRTVVDFSQGKPAETIFTAKEKFIDHTLLAASPHTGYTHQIRAHISAAGFPILGDLLYWQPAAHLIKLKSKSPKPANTPFIDRVALHAAQITFFDTYEDTHRIFIAEPPSDFMNCLDDIRIL